LFSKDDLFLTLEYGPISQFSPTKLFSMKEKITLEFLFITASFKKLLGPILQLELTLVLPLRCVLEFIVIPLPIKFTVESINVVAGSITFFID
jgi:hypothetical protein